MRSNAQAISDALANIGTAGAHLQTAHNSIEKAKNKLQNAQTISDIEAARTNLQTALISIGAAETKLKTALASAQAIQTNGQIVLHIVVSFVLGIALAAFGWYELFQIEQKPLFNRFIFLIFGSALLVSCVVAVYLAETIPLAQSSRQKYLTWFFCSILLALIGIALSYGILHELGYRNTLLDTLGLTVSTLLIVTAPLVTFVILSGYKFKSNID